MGESSPRPLLDAFLLPDGRPKPERWRGVPSSLARVIHNGPQGESLSELLDRLEERRRASQRRRRMMVAFDAGLAAHQHGHLRWGRVGKPGATVAEVRQCFRSMSKRILRRWKFDYMAVVGVSKRGIVHVHFAWFGDYVPVDWIAKGWADVATVGVTPGINCWVEDVGDLKAIRRYLGRQLVGYLGKQEGQGRWSCSPSWRADGVMGSPSVQAARTGVAPTSVLGSTALEFVRGVWYSPRRERVTASIYADQDGHLHSMRPLAEIVDAVR